MFSIHNDQLGVLLPFHVNSISALLSSSSQDMVLNLFCIMSIKIATMLIIPLEGISWDFEICNYVNTIKECFKSPLDASSNKLSNHLILTLLRGEQGIKPCFAVVIVALL